jgi:hypothetical protein
MMANQERYTFCECSWSSDGLFGNKDNEDYSWDTIWDSKVSLTDFGWVVEMRIPYAALRFSNSQKQTWGLNFMREVRDVQKYTWNRVDTKIGSVLYLGSLKE